MLVTMTAGRTVEGSHALMSLRSVPYTGRLGLQRVGIEPDPGNYILPLASVAAMQGRIAMYHALGEAVNPLRSAGENVEVASGLRRHLAGQRRGNRWRGGRADRFGIDTADRDGCSKPDHQVVDQDHRR